MQGIALKVVPGFAWQRLCQVGGGPLHGVASYCTGGVQCVRCCTLLQAIALEVYSAVYSTVYKYSVASYWTLLQDIAQRAQTVLQYTFHIALCFVLHYFDEIN